MTAKYAQLPTDDEDKVPVFDFASIHNFNYPKYFSYSSQNSKYADSKKYKSIFTYSGDHMDEPDIAIEEASLVVKICAYLVTILCYIGLILTLPISAFFCLKNIQQHERYVIFRLGRLLKAKGPGVIIILPCIDKWTKVDLRMKAFSVPPQMILTVDGGGVEIGAEVYYRIKDPVQSIKRVQDLSKSARILAQSALHKTIVKHELKTLETERNKISDILLNELNETTQRWGAEISKVDLSQLKVLQQPPEQSIMGQNPLSVIGPMLFPQGSSNIPFHQMGPQGMAPQPVVPQGVVPQAVMPQAGDQGGAEALIQMMGLMAHAHAGGDTGTLGTLVEVEEPEAGAAEVTGERRDRSDLSTPEDLIAAVKPKLGPELVNEFGCVYKFVISGSDGGTFYLDLKNGGGDVGQGEPPSGMCDVTLSMTSDTLTQLLIGQISAFGAYMGGAMEVEGDLSAARKLGTLIDNI